MHPDMHYDAIVIGGGFAGLSAALQLARARRRVLVIDAGEPRNRFSEASHGFLGHDGRPPAAVLRDARKQLMVYSSAAVVDDRAVHAARHSDGFAVTLASGDVYSGARLVLATGIVDELPDIAGVRERWGRTVLHCPYCHGYEVADQRLGVLATSELSVHQALLIPDWSADVTLFTNNVVELTDEQDALLSWLSTNHVRHARLEDR